MTPPDARRPRGLYVLRQDAFEQIYGPDQRATIDELVEIAAPPLTADELAERPEVIHDVEVLLSGWGAPLVDEDFLERAPALRLVLYGGGAVRGFATDALFARGILLSSANAANAVPVSEYALAAILFSLKHGWRLMRRRPPEIDDPARQYVPGAYRSVVGLIGIGTIGRLVAERLRGFDLRVLAFDPYLQPEAASTLGVTLVDLDQLFQRSAAVSVHAPLHAGTRHLIRGRHLELLPGGATFINTARGGVVDHDELAGVLASRPDLQAVLDVTEPEPLPADHQLLALDNVVVTPHIAGSLGPECRRLGDTMVAELRRYRNGEALLHLVDPAALEIAATP